MRILFLDCDGTIRTPKSGAKFINDPHDQMLIEGVPKALENAVRKFDKIVGITNQGGVAAGYKSLDDVIAEQQITLELAPQIESILFCSDFEGENAFVVDREECRQITVENFPFAAIGLMKFRKPDPGMIEFILSNNEEVDRNECWMIGDRPEDEEAAQNAGINFLPADPWHRRHRPGIHEFEVSMEQIRFLEPWNID